MKKLTITLGLLVAFSAGNMQAQTKGMEARQMNTECCVSGHNVEDMFTKMDVNKDGQLDKTEMGRRMQDNFDKVDTNQDGSISLEEFKAAPMHKAKCGHKMHKKEANKSENHSHIRMRK